MSKKTIILSSICGGILLLIIILSIMNSTTKDHAKKLNDAKTFFEINNVINKENSEDNIMYSYVSTDIYYKETGLITTYFVKGFSLIGSMNLTYTENVCYLVKIKGITYEISKINTNDIKEYADDYTEEAKDLDTNSMMPTFVLNEKNKLIYYLSVFSYLLTYNKSEAYNYLADDQKAEYQSETDFINNASNIMNNLSISVEDFSTEEKGKETIYTINTGGKSQVTIYENGVMNFKIDY